MQLGDRIRYRTEDGLGSKLDLNGNRLDGPIIPGGAVVYVPVHDSMFEAVG